MKKALTLILTLALVISMAVPAFAADKVYTENDTTGQTNLSFTAPAAAVPTYTVTIPSNLALAIGHTSLPITVSDSADLGSNGIIVITAESTNQLFAGTSDRYLTSLYPNGVYMQTNRVDYYLKDANGEYITDFNYFDSGAILATFDGNGAKSINFEIIAVDYYVQPGVPYTGWIQFGIQLKK